MKSFIPLCSAIALIGTIASAEEPAPIRSQNDHRATLLIQHEYRSMQLAKESMTTTPEMKWSECLNLKKGLREFGKAKLNGDWKIAMIDVSNVVCLDLETGMSR